MMEVFLTIWWKNNNFSTITCPDNRTRACSMRTGRPPSPWWRSVNWLYKCHCIAIVDSSHTSSEDSLCKSSHPPVVILINPDPALWSLGYQKSIVEPPRVHDSVKNLHRDIQFNRLLKNNALRKVSGQLKETGCYWCKTSLVAYISLS